MASYKFLEIDSKPSVFSNLVLSEESEMEVDKPVSNSIDNAPQLGICGKARTDKNEKCFINILHHPAVSPPQSSFDIKNIAHYSSKEFLHKVPMMVGEMHVELDKAGNECKCYDVIVNNKFYKELSCSASSDNCFQFLLKFASFAVSMKYGIIILNDTLKHLNKVYHGRKPLYFMELESSEVNFDLYSTNDIVFEKDNEPVKNDLPVSISSNDISCSKAQLDWNVVIPKAGKCIMFKTVKNEKIFINICHCDEVPPPSPSLDWQKLKLKSAEECLHEIPLSLSGPHIEEDETNCMFKCYDTVINSQFYYELSGSVSHENLQFIMFLACSALTMKYGVLIDFSYFEHLLIPYKGYSMNLHTIQLVSKVRTNSVCLKIISNDDSSCISSYASFHNLESSCLKVTPRAGNCVMGKTDKNKIFVNLCHSPEVPIPDSSLDWNMFSFRNIEEYMNKIPMSLGDPHFEVDLNKGEKYVCYDVVINSKFYYELSGSVSNKNLNLITLLACSVLELKYGFTIDYESLEHQLMPYMGTEIVMHDIKLQPRSKRNEIPLDNSILKGNILMPVSSNHMPSSTTDVSNYNLFEALSNVKAIMPNPGLCVKGKTNNNEKVFINLCHHPDVPPPPPSLNVEGILNSSEESLFRFPLSLGDLHLELDKTGNKCKCYDVVINSDYYHEVTRKTALRDFILVLASSGLERKNNIIIDVGTFRFLNKPYHGNMTQHFIRLQSNMNAHLSLDEFVSSGDIMMPISDASHLIPFLCPKITSYKLFQKSKTSGSFLIFQGLCTGVSDKTDLSVFVFNFKLTIEDKNGKILLSIPLPYLVSPQASLANLKNSRLIITIPIV